MTVSRSQRAAIAALSALNVAILVATSPPPGFSAHDETEPLPISLSPDSPHLYVDGMVEAGEIVESLTLTLTFEGNNLAPASGQLSLYALPEDSDTLPEGADPQATAVIDAKAGEALPTSAMLSTTLSSDDFGAFHLLVVLEGEAELDGTLVVSASASLDKDDPSLWIKLSEVEATHGDTIGEVAP